MEPEPHGAPRKRCAILQMRGKKPQAGRKHAHWVQTASGKAFDLAAEDAGQVDIRDIAAQLAKICRFSGATCQFYSVAQHSVLMAIALKKFGPLAQLHGLLHDAHEAYVGDVTRPVHNLLAALHPHDALAELKDMAQRAILAALKLTAPAGKVAQAIEIADEALLATELRDLMADPERDWGLKTPPLQTAIVAWPWPRAEEKFLACYHDLTVAAGIGVGVA